MDYAQVQVHLSNQDKEEYKALTDMIESPGWTLYKRWLNERYQASLFRQLDAKSWEQNREEKGHADELAYLLGYENMIEAEFQEKADIALLQQQEDDLEIENDPL